MSQVIISVSVPETVLKAIDRRADSLGLPRSRYLVAVAQQDIAKGDPLMLNVQEEYQPAPPVELTPFAEEILKLAIPALTQYQDSHGQCSDPQVPARIRKTELWEFFLKQRDQILKNKWNDSRNAGYDIGMERALRNWLQINQDLWVEPPPE